ncbi:hypothetical protein N0V82_007551 [Gnomoniopsis sp. IMI 355080]|nr:hypothetical protein N0V82_007551 [Gnomoniopsis sp. IMI 355080]
MSSLPGAEMVRLLVGPNKREFTIHKKLLCASSSFFRYSLESTSSEPSSPSSVESDSGAISSFHSEKLIWLSEECPEMMELFVLWLYQRNSFRMTLEQKVAAVTVAPKPANQAKILNNRRQLHWNLVKLHLFAAVIRLPVLQDIAMDAIQDLYLRCDWDVSQNFVRFLYEECTREQAFRLRKWAVAMLAWTLGNNSGDPLAFNDLFDEFPELRWDFSKHMEKMDDSRADYCVKNPQLRLPRNKLRNEERQFGFRQCSFHSHRSSVGEGKCPYAVDQPESPLKESFGSRSSHAEVKPCVAKTSPKQKRHARMKSSTSQIWTVQESAEET